jgi:glutamate synthase domain-containing protein 3
MNDLPVDQSAENPANPAMTMVSGLDENGLRLSSMDFERLVRLAAAESSEVVLRTYGQHNIGIRLQRPEGLHLEISGPCGQRLGCMGMPGTSIICHNAVSDDVGYLNIGAEITILGDATNGVCNAMAAGKVFIGGSIGARGLTMTKWNPDYERPELWVLGSTGDSFAEFNCGGVAVVCGIEPKNPDNVLGYRPASAWLAAPFIFVGPSTTPIPEQTPAWPRPMMTNGNGWLSRCRPILKKSAARSCSMCSPYVINGRYSTP